MLRFEVTSKQAGDTAGSIRIAFRGHLTFGFVPQFNREINTWLSKGVRSLEFDFREVTYLDSPGICAVVAASRLAKEMNATVRVLNTRKLVHHLFKSARFDRELEFGVSVEAETLQSYRALDAVQTPRWMAA